MLRDEPATRGRVISEDELAELYGALCDAVCREALNTPDDDPFQHTSDIARATANRLVQILIRHRYLDAASVAAAATALQRRTERALVAARAKLAFVAADRRNGRAEATDAD